MQEYCVPSQRMSWRGGIPNACHHKLQAGGAFISLPDNWLSTLVSSLPGWMDQKIVQTFCLPRKRSSHKIQSPGTQEVIPLLGDLLPAAPEAHQLAPPQRLSRGPPLPAQRPRRCPRQALREASRPALARRTALAGRPRARSRRRAWRAWRARRRGRGPLSASHPGPSASARGKNKKQHQPCRPQVCHGANRASSTARNHAKRTFRRLLLAQQRHVISI